MLFCVAVAIVVLPPSRVRLYKPVDQEEALRDALDKKRKHAEESEEARQDRCAEGSSRRRRRGDELQGDESSALASRRQLPEMPASALAAG